MVVVPACKEWQPTSVIVIANRGKKATATSVKLFVEDGFMRLKVAVRVNSSASAAKSSVVRVNDRPAVVMLSAASVAFIVVVESSSRSPRAEAVIVVVPHASAPIKYGS